MIEKIIETELGAPSSPTAADRRCRHQVGSAVRPVLLWPACGAQEWVIGGWNGAEWHDEDGFLFTPVWLAPLPASPG